MQIIKRGLLLAALSVVALTLGASSAVADPIGAPWIGGGSINLDGGLGGSSCTNYTIGGPDGTTITAITFSGCSGAAGTPTALVIAAIQWNARNTGGQFTTAYLMNVSGLAQCLYSGWLQFTYNATTRTMTIGPTTIGLLRQLSGLPICPTGLEVTGSVTIY